ncbi:Predicted PurR-regulated permease PerM [Paenibacillus sp. UNCCL117]|uniref:AI-2E family transporter n=1 Tax=unclassified Paenibacillus TaxID=185978 RepID=UPI000889EC92|nr:MULTISPECIES: AI-2E family transporter [unclassified Paenibacillus]SDD00847.1 Predicted PurR-regulated permease PerM [Paenibacillus sp. cl123]SFW32787.1 Predicted PurR-regulated permease PerM [Paenibacillus sp. UNCCL117]
MDKLPRNRVLLGMIYVLIGLAILLLLMQLRPMISGVYVFLREILTPFIIALIISYVLNPVVSLLGARRVPRTIAVLLIYAMFIMSMTVILMNVIPMFVKQLAELNQHMPDVSFRAQSLVDNLNGLQFLPDSVRIGINQSLSKLEAGISAGIANYIDGIGNTINALFMIFIIPFVSFYMLKDFQLLEKTTLAIVPKTHRKEIVSMLMDIDTALGNYIRGQFTVCVIIGVLAYIGYWAIGMPYALLLASIVAVFNIIPYLGPFLGAAPALIVASTISIKMVLLVIVVNTVCQILEGNVISPQVVGRSLKMHPLFIIFALLVGGEVAGIAGLILAVPFFAVMKVILQHLFLYYVHRRTVH